MNNEIGEQRKPEKEGVIFLIYKNGKVLLEDRKRPDKPYFGYKIIPGGKVEKETDCGFDDAAEREALEECGIKVTKMVHLDTFLHMTISNHLYNTATYLITEFEGEVINPEDKSDHIWVDLDEASKLLEFSDSRYVVLLAKQYLAGQNG
jgi:8-oxo-dGTP pyrophosphatase MutT (NUDIX family)